MRGPALAALAGALGGCLLASSGADPGSAAGFDGLAITQVAPATIVPGTELVVIGAGFADAAWGTTILHLEGRIGAGERTVEAHWPATYVDGGTLRIAIDAARFGELGDGAFHGAASVEVIAASDHRRFTTAALPVALELRSRLAPAPATIAQSGVMFVNDRIEVTGDGFLLGGDEGTTTAEIAGCFVLASGATGQACAPIATAELAATPATARSRTAVSFAFSPRIAGIRPGSFTGTVTLVNRQPGAPPEAAPAIAIAYELVTPQVFAIATTADSSAALGSAASSDPPAASLGQYVFVHGGGFVGGEPGAATELELVGTLAPTSPPGPAEPIELTLIPEFVAGRLVRYVVSSDDALGDVLDLRTATGTLTAMLTPVVSYGRDRVRGLATPVVLAIAPVKQVVYLQFAPSYGDGLRDFGLGAVDSAIRDGVVAACRAAYRGVNVEFRVAPPTDFAEFETVELVGSDPNDQGLFGYDNSPGKDSGNLRLYDRIGGVNAQTQADGYPGFGGVFVRSLLGFSLHPGALARSASGADPLFDQIFDPFRPDRGGAPVASADLVAALAPLNDGTSCPGSGRQHQIRCAIYVLANLIASTVSHEIGHSLGLANPYQDGFHAPGDAPNRLMDAGEARPFRERAVLRGQGPAVFCDDEFRYLQAILPPPEPAPPIDRPSCR